MNGSPEASGRGGDEARPRASAPVLEFREIVKSFAGQVAVDHVSFSVHAGEIHGLVGENGAGKSTLIKVLAGEYQADSGEILFDGEPFRSSHPSEATRQGIGFIHQVPALVPTLSVAENIALGLRFMRGPVGLISWARHHRSVRAVLEKVGLGYVNPATALERLSVAERQLVALARILTIDLRVVVFDEVTAPLTEHEVEQLFHIIRELQDDGVAVVYISHRLGEIFELADRVTVMKNGAHVATQDVRGLTSASLTRLIVGKDPAERFEDTPLHAGRKVVLSLEGICDEVLEDVSFNLHEGELLGLAGLDGAGRTNVLETIFGARRPEAGRVLLDGEEVTFRHPAGAVVRGIGLVTEDRLRDGFVPEASIAENVTLPWLRRFSRAGVLRLNREREIGQEAVQRFDIRARSERMPMYQLSGGNQQKTILARWLMQPLRILLLDEPTHGVDVGAKDEIYHLIREIAEQGVAVIMVSSELDELEGLCTRVLTLVEGRVVGELVGADINEANMLGELYARP